MSLHEIIQRLDNDIQELNIVCQDNQILISAVSKLRMVSTTLKRHEQTLKSDAMDNWLAPIDYIDC